MTLAQTSTEPTYLVCPFAQKDAAKAVGARWSASARKWFAPAGYDLAPFAAWLPRRAAAAADSPFGLCGATAFTRSAGQGLAFDGPLPLRRAAPAAPFLAPVANGDSDTPDDPDALDVLLRTQLRERGVQRPTLELLLSAGVREFYWLSPSEPLGPHDGSDWPDGGFVYLFDEAELDCVFSLRECREHEPIARLGGGRQGVGKSTGLAACAAP